MNFELFGFLGGFTVSLALVPQVIKSWRTKSTKDISLLWNGILFVGLIFWVIYGIGIWSMPILIFTTIETFLTLSLLTLKLMYDKKT